VTVKPGHLAITGKPGSVVTSDHDRETGDETRKVHDPRTKSIAHADAGDFSLTVTDADSIGRDNETRVAKALADRLSVDGSTVRVEEGDDDRGEDRLLVVDGRSFVLQIITAPADSGFWRAASSTTASIREPLSEAVMWLRGAIEQKGTKTPEDQANSTVLAIDSWHSSVLTKQDLLAEYLSRFGSPRAEYGFASVWIVGPTSDWCARLGNGLI